MQVISSKDNELIKHIKKLKNKKYRDLNNEYIIEGIKIIEEAINEKANIKQVVICDDCEKTSNIPKDLMYEIAKQECVYVTSKIFESLTDVTNPQGILAIVEKNSVKSKIKNTNNVENGEESKTSKIKEKEEQTENEIDYNQDIIVALDDIQDPGNLGTILRTVDSIGINQILVSKGTADSYNPKVVRSTMGAIFRVKIIECEDLEKTLEEIKKHKFEIVVTSLQTKNSIYDIDYKKKVIVIGNEANGVGKGIQKIADKKVKIPMLGKTESLNASVATGVILYEYVRQKLEH